MQVQRSLICALFAVSCCAQNTYTISGTVVAETSGKELKNVMVAIRQVGEKKPAEAAVITGDNGRFVFPNLPRGKYSLTAQKEGGFVRAFHQDGNYSTAIVTGPGLNSENIRFPVTLLGSIAGTVVDEDNEPVRNAQIMLFRRGVFAGKTAIELRQYAQTNSSGTFHFARLLPGTFLIAVSAQPWYAQSGQMGFAVAGGTLGNVTAQDGAGPTTVNPEFDVAYPITYYGGGTDPNAALPVSVSEGNSTRIEIALHPVPAAHIQFQNTDSGGAFAFTAIGPGGLPLHPGVQYMGIPNGGTQARLAPGRYVIQSPKGGKRVVEIGGDSSLDEHDVPISTISGRLTVEGEEHAEIGNLLLFSIDHPNLEAEVAGDGSFSVSGAEAGKYEVQLPNAPGYYIKSVLVGERPSPDDQFEVAEGANTKILVAVAKGGSRLEGVAFRDGAPCAGAMVLLIPQNPNRTSLIRRDQSDSDGTFALPNVAPGRYTLLAIDNGHDLPYAEPGVINPYLANGQLIDVPLGDGARLTVKVQSRQH